MRKRNDRKRTIKFLDAALATIITNNKQTITTYPRVLYKFAFAANGKTCSRTTIGLFGVKIYTTFYCYRCFLSQPSICSLANAHYCMLYRL